MPDQARAWGVMKDHAVAIDTFISTFPGAEAAIAAAGLVIAPREATPSMSLAGVIEIVNAIGSGGRKPLKTDIAANVYRAMIDAR